MVTLEDRCILIIEDDPTIAEVLGYNLGRLGYRVLQERDGRAGLGTALSCDVDLLLLDLMLPELDGMTIARELTRQKPTLPIIMLTARSERETVLEGFDVGADDYVVKPFDLDELIARIGARLRRVAADQQTHEPEAAMIEFAGLRVDSDTHTMRTAAGQVTLKPKEHDLLRLLLSRPAHLFGREEIVQRVWHQQYLPTSRTLDVHVRQLRVKLEEVGAGVKIGAVRGVGYRVTAS